MKYIPVYQPSLVGNEKKYVNECLDTSWISSKGKFVNDFENQFADFIGVKKATTVCNGTVALHLALEVLGIGLGDEVIVPTFTYIASVNSIAMVGAKPVFIDSLEESWNIDFTQIEKKITSKTKAIMVVHMYGLPCEMNEILKICDKYNLFLIEDAAEAFGSLYDGIHVGNFGTISTFSFFGNKTITTGEGGMIVSNSIDLIDNAAYLKSQAVSSAIEYWHDDLGYNYRMTNICAAIGVAQLERAEYILQKKNQLARWYMEELRGLPILFQKDSDNITNSFWMVSILVSTEKICIDLRDFLKKNFIETRPFFHPAHTMPKFKTDECYPIAESLSKRGINLPSYHELTQDDVKNICSAIKSFFKLYNR